MIDLTNKRFAITGLQGSGKSNLAKHLLSLTRSHLVYDPLMDYVGYHRYQPTDNYSKPELDAFLRNVVIPWKPSLVIVDEANKYIEPHPSRLPEGVQELNDWSRHYGIAWGLICRRPVQMHTDMLELAHFIFTFQLRGHNDQRFFDNIRPGLGDEVASLGSFEFMVIEGGQAFRHAPVPEAPARYRGLTKSRKKLKLAAN